MESTAARPVTVVTVAAAAPARVASGAPLPWRQVGVGLLLVAWGLGIAWQMRGHLHAWSSVRRIRSRALPLRHPEMEEAVRELAARAGLRRVPRLLVSEEVTSPMATGLLSPVVVLPARAVRRLDTDALQMALAHELAHFLRRDLWLGWVPAVAEIVLFFHPLVRKAAREYALAREEACDAEALHLTGAEPGDYGQLLLTFGVTRTHGTAAALGASRPRSHAAQEVDHAGICRCLDASNPGLAGAALVVLGLAVLVPFQVVAREPGVSATAREGGSPARGGACSRSCARARCGRCVRARSVGGAQGSLCPRGGCCSEGSRRARGESGSQSGRRAPGGSCACGASGAQGGSRASRSARPADAGHVGPGR